MSKVVTVRIPPWISEEEFRKIVNEVIAKLGGRIDIEDLRRELGIKPSDLVEDLDVYDVEYVELKEKEELQ